MANPLLPPELLRRLEQFQLLAQRRAKSSLRGERRSRARGQSVEFADYRNYSVGDDFRTLDWNLYARLDKLFIKLYEEERELPITIFLDASESMGFGTPQKFHYAKQLVAAFGYVGLVGFDRVSIHAFPNSPEDGPMRSALRSVRGRKTTLRFFENVSQLKPGGAATFNESLRRAVIEARHAGLAIVISDFLDPAGYDAGLTALISRGFQVSAIQVLAPEEISPPNFGDLKLVDSETGAVQEVTFMKHRLNAYQQTVRNFCQRLREFCQTRGINFFQASTDMPLEDLLLKQLRAAEVWG
ncbi:MAG TPA: DUF58 domain-containing protein [Methylomirabilota bacterium]|nr:DUF58 domain-containing protein [Methylomirabilota bacterium]